MAAHSGLRIRRRDPDLTNKSLCPRNTHHSSSARGTKVSIPSLHRLGHFLCRIEDPRNCMCVPRSAISALCSPSLTHSLAPCLSSPLLILPPISCSVRHLPRLFTATAMFLLPLRTRTTVSLHMGTAMQSKISAPTHNSPYP